MKTNIVASSSALHFALGALIALLIVCLPDRASAQSFVTTGGATQQTLFADPAADGGFDFDSSGNLYTIGTPDVTNTDTVVSELTAASGYTSQTTIADFGTKTFGSFLLVNGNTAYYGESPTFTGGVLNFTSLPVTTAGAPGFIANVPDIYSMEFSGATAFVSANPSTTDNLVSTINLSTGVLKTILNTGDAASGPIAFTSSGSLLYGQSGINGGPGDIYLFTASQVSTAIASGTPLTINSGQLIIHASGNSAFEVVGNDLFDAFNNFSTPATLTMYDLGSDAATLLGTSDNAGDFFAGLSSLNGNAVVAETDGFSETNYIEVFEAIPEPSATWLIPAGLLGIFYLRRKPIQAAQTA